MYPMSMVGASDPERASAPSKIKEVERVTVIACSILNFILLAKQWFVFALTLALALAVVSNSISPVVRQ